MRVVRPIHGLAIDAALCAATEADRDNSLFLRRLSISSNLAIRRLVRPEATTAPAPETHRLRILARISDDGRIEHAVELDSGRRNPAVTAVPGRRRPCWDMAIQRGDQSVAAHGREGPLTAPGQRAASNWGSSARTAPSSHPTSPTCRPALQPESGSAAARSPYLLPP